MTRKRMNIPLWVIARTYSGMGKTIIVTGLLAKNSLWWQPYWQDKYRKEGQCCGTYYARGASWINYRTYR